MPAELQSGVLPPKEGETGGTTPPPKRRGRPPGSKNKPKVDITEQDIVNTLTQSVAVPISFLTPIGAEVLMRRSERTAKAIMRLAARYPGFAKYLKLAMEGSAGLDIAITIIGVSVGAMVDMQRIPYNSFPATAFDIDEIVMELYPPETQNGNTTGFTVKSRGLMGDI